MDDRHRQSADRARSRIESGRHDLAAFRAALLDAPPGARDAWLDLVLGLGELPDDGPDLPRGCVPYFPCAVAPLLRTVDEARVSSSDVFVDVGSGVGRAASFVHLLTGAEVLGVEVQPRLVGAARELAERLRLARITFVEGDASSLPAVLARGSVFFLYCPFSGERLETLLGDLEVVAQARAIRVCSLDVPLPRRSWLTRVSPTGGDVAVHRSTRRAP